MRFDFFGTSDRERKDKMKKKQQFFWVGFGMCLLLIVYTAFKGTQSTIKAPDFSIVDKQVKRSGMEVEEVANSKSVRPDVSRKQEETKSEDRFLALQPFIKRECQKHDFLHKSTDKLQAKQFGNFLVIPNHKILYCLVLKVATRGWRSVLFRHLGGKESMLLSRFPPKEIQNKLRTYSKYMFVREPFERLLSAYRDKFILDRGEREHFYNNFGKDIIKYYRLNSSNIVLNNSSKPPSFSEFLRYVSHPYSPMKTDRHWIHSYKTCHPCAINYDFIGRYEFLKEDSVYLINKMGLKPSVKFPAFKNKIVNSGEVMKKFYSEVPKETLYSTWKAYQIDFDMYNYTIPKWIQDMMNQNCKKGTC